jgi:hypothetical protein
VFGASPENKGQEATMTRPPRIPLLVAALAFAVLLRPIESHACSCTFDHTVMEEFNIATAVFAGTVTNIQPAGDGTNVLVTMTPTIRWKGGFDDPVQVITGMNDGVCGVHFVVGESYLVFAFNTTYSGQPAFFTHSCTRTGVLANNPTVSDLPPPQQPVPTRLKTWGALKTSYR